MTDVIASEWAGRDIRNYTQVTQCKANKKRNKRKRHSIYSHNKITFPLIFHNIINQKPKFQL